MVPFAGLLAALEGIPDSRRRQGRRYPLAHLLLFSVLVVLAGAPPHPRIPTLTAAHPRHPDLHRRAPGAPQRGVRRTLLSSAGREHAARSLPGARRGRAGGRL